eukprot:SM000029S10432  [mRNA]  locus=s29:52280:54529:- [translate_table: standard]
MPASAVPRLSASWSRRSAAEREKAREAKVGTATGLPAVGISAAALRLLAELDPTPYCILDVRTKEAARAIPAPFQGLVNVPEAELRVALQMSQAAWQQRFGSAKQPSRRGHELLVFVAEQEAVEQRAVASATALGFTRCCFLAGGLVRLEAGIAKKPSHLINRDAVALLLAQSKLHRDGVAGGELDSEQGATLIDLRRHDERALYGFIPQSRHIPVDQWPGALALDEKAWVQRYHFPKVAKDDVIILQCRTSRRSTWAAQVAHDAGYSRCFVYKQGVYGWRLDPAVMSYDSYEEEEPPPTPREFEVEAVDWASAEQELAQLGLL